ncbi:MOG interacting and ectopic P-granules protein 1-like [Quillaja saponaria]|uniref:MOG interacting and ectopic P-granules protein 1-like n=1 Tax=Quillaja saponaria TaxID=32244 RepID=A0AAD7PRF4_QUISA|nr:MOG interacting and ectopic P-granules protein 1-like [Quillaja saponaria]
MGGCAGKPREVDIDEDERPVEAPATPKQAEGETVAQKEKENNEGGESEKKEEAPLVDLSDTKEEAKAEPSFEAIPVSTEPAATESEKPKEETVEAKPEETKVEAVEETPEVQQAKEDEVEAKADKPVTPPNSADKSDAPLVTA